MKRFILILAVLLLPLVVFAQTATTRIDTIKTPAYTGDAGKYSATWELTLTTANDTLRPPWPAMQVIVIHKGATSGDTVQVSYSQTTNLKWSGILTANGDVESQTAQTASFTKVYLKSNGTVKVLVRMFNAAIGSSFNPGSQAVTIAGVATEETSDTIAARINLLHLQAITATNRIDTVAKRVDSVEVTLDRIGAQLPAAKPARFLSTINNGYNATAYTVGDIVSDSTGTASFANAVLVAGAKARALFLISKWDTLITGSFKYRFYTDSIALIANNAPNVLISANLTYFLGEAVVSVTSGQTGSTASFGQVLLYGGLPLQSTTRKIFYTVEALTAFTPKKAGQLVSELILIYD